MTKSTLAIALLKKYGGEADDFFKLWPDDKQYLYSKDGQAFLAYRVNKGVAICMGEPVGPKKSVTMLLKQFDILCNQNKWLPVFIQTTDKYHASYQTSGYRRILIGADALINTDEFISQTLKTKYFRNLVNRIDKQGYYLSSHKPPHSKALISELHEVSSSWVKLPNRKEWSFLTGRFNNDYLQQVELHVLRDNQGKALAFANELPVYKQGVATIDLMRRRADSPANSIDFLFIELIKLKHQQKFEYFNLGISPIDGRYFSKTVKEKILMGLYRSSDSLIGFRGLHQFKSKYQPNWEPRYVWYKGSIPSLVKIGLAIASIMKV